MQSAIPSFLYSVIFHLFLFGIAFGSFANVLIARLPEKKSIRGRSMCPACKHTLSALELIPLVSYAMLRGKCKGCKKSISIQYPLVELAGGLLFILAGHLTEWSTIPTAFLAVSLVLLLAIAIIDARTERISDALNIPLLLTAGLYSFTSGSFDPYAVAIGVGFLGFQWLVSRGTWIGTGDMILIVSISLLASTWSQMLFGLFAAYIFGGFMAGALLLSKKKSRTDSLAFAPFLALGLLAALLLGEQVLWKLYAL